MLEKVKQNAKSIIEISYTYDTLMKDKKDKKKIKEIEKRIYDLVQENNNEIKEAKSMIKNA